MAKKRACDDGPWARGTFFSRVQSVGWNQASVWKLTIFPQCEKLRQNASEQWRELWLIIVLSTLKYRSSVQQATCCMCCLFCELCCYMHIEALVFSSVIQNSFFFPVSFPSFLWVRITCLNGRKDSIWFKYEHDFYCCLVKTLWLKNPQNNNKWNTDSKAPTL